MFNEKPPMLGGDVKKDLVAIRDYLFRMARGLEDVSSGTTNIVAYDRDGRQVQKPGGGGGTDEDEIRRNAEELKALIIKSANEIRIEYTAGDETVVNYVDGKTVEYNSLYVAQSDFGEFSESINTRIDTTARGIVESYNYGASIQSLQDSIGLIQDYFTSINGEIRRGIVLDPSTNTYVTGIAIAQSLSFAGECGPTDANNPGDGLTYYYLTSGQTFGLYTSSGWQFWIDGYKKGWYNSQDGMLHIENLYVENSLQLGTQWRLVVSLKAFDINYVGG